MFMTTLQTHANMTTLTKPELARQLAAAMKRGASALIASPAATLSLLDEAAALLAASRTRVLHVRPPYNLTSFMQQIAPSGSEEDGSLLDSAYDTLTVLDPSCDRIALLAESAHLMPKVTLRYIESLVCKRAQLCVALAGKPELAEALAADDLSDLREELSLHLALSESTPAASLPVAAPRPMTAPVALAAPSRRPWIVAGFFGTVCIGLIASQVLNTLRPDGRGPAAVPAADAPSAVQPKLVQDVPRPGPLLPVPEVASSPAEPAEPRVAAAPPAVSPAPPAPIAPPAAVSPPMAPIAALVQPAAAASAVAPAILEPAMLTLPGGEFRMGSSDDPSERPPHAALVAPFLLAEHAVSMREWQQCEDAKACPAVANGKSNEPVTNVSWEDARLFAAWLARTTGQPYRLPTEAEWEYAARAGANTRYAWGNAVVPGKISCKGCAGPVSLQYPPRVDAYPPNAFGLYGMGGGVKEWVADCWHHSYQGAPRSGSIPWDAPDCRERVLRGGSWMDDAASVRVSSREYYDASVRYPTHGFRVAKSK